MDDLTKILTAIFGGVVLIALASVIVSKRSQAPQAIHAISSGIANIVAAAVNPVSANYGYGSGAQTGVEAVGASSLTNSFLSSAGDLSAIIPGGFK